MAERVLVLLSGGLDSTTLASLLSDKYNPSHVHALFVSYGQQHETREVDASRLVANKLNLASWDILNIPTELLQLASSGLTGQAVIPDIDYSEINGLSPSYVPFRNGVLISLITARALQMEIELVAIGVHADDGANWAYPDCTPEFIGAMTNAVHIGSYQKVRLIAPFVYATKAEIASIAWAINAPVELSWSCYHAGEIHCGVCPTCRSRRTAFAEAFVADPTKYANEVM